MNRKDYQLIANTLGATMREHKADPERVTGIAFATVAILKMLAANNPAFDVAKFTDAVDKAAGKC